MRRQALRSVRSQHGARVGSDEVDMQRHPRNLQKYKISSTVDGVRHGARGIEWAKFQFASFH
jgi:hypothetical protein